MARADLSGLQALRIELRRMPATILVAEDSGMPVWQAGRDRPTLALPKRGAGMTLGLSLSPVIPEIVETL